MKRAILLLLTHSCNLSCKYCYEKFKDSRKMSSPKAIDILEQEFAVNSEDITNIDLLGGEPLANFDIIPVLCDWIWSKKTEMQIFIRTNGTLLSPHMKCWFSQHRKLLGLGLSIDGTPITNLINRGVKNVDLEYFKENWPDVPVKITVFPDTVDSLFESVIYLYNKGFNITGGLAQGVMWNDVACNKLNKQMEKLTELYLSDSSRNPITPLFSLDFNQAFTTYDATKGDIPCWNRNIVHTYDCDYEKLPCHMFSVLVQGQQKQKLIARASTMTKEIIDSDCRNCPIRWSCINCMALNFQRYGTFDKNINRELACKAHKITAYWSAVLLTSRAQLDLMDLSISENRESVSNAITYIKTYGEY
ncbi:MAG: 4Fe-4S cluster-binding domain-containing protein [Bacteroidales bacterium]|nr:4Fe-4S cluster-binding domain-containing protein [Bacteroidales bacterium]MCM1146466.1 4Fe-4S cluster-binding domain-containing protein [Bacteroidales bacterium]MCM1205096.1 4Fe-4S cluster-binding domain-containing protein [Bacillota bacterium]MCM1509342.1 4Fe-4S cluster-binding domain-containing protein [Clostridium sp.]